MNCISKIPSTTRTYFCEQLFQRLSFERASKIHSGQSNGCMKIAFLPSCVNICFAFDVLLKVNVRSKNLLRYFFLDYCSPKSSIYMYELASRDSRHMYDRVNRWPFFNPLLRMFPSVY